MLKAKRFGTPLMPILHHAAIHAVLMAIVLWFAAGYQTALLGFAIQLLSHFVIDVWKGRMNVWFPQLTNPANVYHWWVFGIDQQMHIAVVILLTVLGSA